ncbi:FliO/MopB family protein [Massilia sp. TW-1]|uniref:FliO/MopB family protein n=1 Tax=Telluria antibiotica TaxID=2717319 RepID=A0ABX0PDF3_9BURK|nr:flagellar biosynthetic protein FliO [Telluria antibiotica]NIA55050.1 FliO/MopB family protein [Telluria antibiotica]
MPASDRLTLAAPQPIPFKHDGGGAGAGVAGGGLAVLLVALAAIGAVLYLRKRLNLPLPGSGGQRLVKVLQSERMGPRALLSVVEFDGRRYLLAQGEHGITCVATSAASEPKEGT